MTLNYKPFQIHLNSFFNFLQDNIPNSDGIVTYEEYFEIIETSQFTQDDINLILDYYDNLTEEGELEKFNLSLFESNKISIINSIDFGKNLYIEFLSTIKLLELTEEQNNTLYLDQDLRDIKYLLSIGALSLALTKLENLEQKDGLPQEVVNDYEQKIRDYLNIE